MRVDSVADFGVDSISYIAKGQYAVYLNTVDPYSGTQVNFNHGYSVTATSVVQAVGVPPLIVVQVSTFGWGTLPPNAFEIYVTNGTSFVEGEVSFHVFGRQ
jgi:hypothetical protein